MPPREAVERLGRHLGQALPTVEFRGEVTAVVGPAHLPSACRFLKEQCGFDMLVDLAGVDNLGEPSRFEVDYLLRSLADRCCLRLKVHLPEDHPQVESVAAVWRTADWHEREAFDLLGIRFVGHPNLQRILMWEGYPHHPLRKDFPLAGLTADLPPTAVGAGQVAAAPMLGGPYVPGRAHGATGQREPRQFDTAAEQQDRAADPHRQEPV